MKTDVLFIHPGGQKNTYQGLASSNFTAISTPVWALLISDYVRRKGYRVNILDTNVEGWDVKVIDKYNPELVVVMVFGHHPSASTQTMPCATQIIEDIKSHNKDIPIAMGGSHPSALPEQTMKEVCTDYVIQGEGLYTIEGLIGYFKGHKSARTLKNIDGLCYRKDSEIEFTKKASIIKDLDTELTSYAWDLLPGLDKYRAHNMHCFQDFEESKMDDFSDVRSPYAALYTSLGCPFSCSFCMINDIFGGPGIRYWNLDTVMGWLDELVTKYKVRNIRFEDELFILSRNRVENLCDRIIERGYDLNIMVYARVNRISDKLIAKLAKAGVTWIAIGMESADEQIKKGVNKGYTADVREVVKSIHSHGIHVLNHMMFGLPGDTFESMKRTFGLAQELNCEFSNIYTVKAYPGSQLYKMCDKDDLPKNWESFSQHSYQSVPLPTKKLRSKDILAFRDQAFAEYFHSEKYLNMVKDKFGDKAHNYIVDMTKIKLKRQLLGD